MRGCISDLLLMLPFSLYALPSSPSRNPFQINSKALFTPPKKKSFMKKPWFHSIL